MTAAVAVKMNGEHPGEGLHSETVLARNHMLVYNRLVQKLTSRGLAHVEIVRFCKDAFNLVQQQNTISLWRMNYALAALGWGEDTIDLSMYDLIMYMYELEHDYRHNAQSGTGRHYQGDTVPGRFIIKGRKGDDVQQHRSSRHRE